MIEALTISLIVLFIHAAFWKDHIFGSIRKVIKPEGMIYKPIYGCCICMCPWWGSAIYWVLYAVSVRDWVLTIAIASGFSVVWSIGISIKDALNKLTDE